MTVHKKTKVVLTDISLKDCRGHHFELTRNLCDPSVTKHFDVYVFAHKEFAGHIENVTVMPLFSKSMYDAYVPKGMSKIATIVDGALGRGRGLNSAFRHLVTRLKRVIHRQVEIITRIVLGTKEHKEDLTLRDICRELTIGIKRLRLSSTDHIVFHTSDGLVFGAVALLLSQETPENLPAIHLSTPYSLETMPNKPARYSIFGYVDSLSFSGIIGKKVFLYAETRSLAKVLSKELRADVMPLFLPPPTQATIRERRSSDPIEIAYLGPAREEKGFLVLPAIITAISREIFERPIHFTIQCSSQIVGYQQSIIQTIEELRALPASLVTLLETEQNPERFAKLLERSDVILLPYDQDRYRHRGSGIAVEALSYGNVLLTTSETFPAELIERGGGETADSIEGYVSGLKRILRNFKPYREAALRNAQRYRGQYNAIKYVQSAVSRVAEHRLGDSSETGENGVALIVYSQLIENETNWLGATAEARYLRSKGLAAFVLYSSKDTSELNKRHQLTTLEQLRVEYALGAGELFGVRAFPVSGGDDQLQSAVKLISSIFARGPRLLKIRVVFTDTPAIAKYARREFLNTPVVVKRKPTYLEKRRAGKRYSQKILALCRYDLIHDNRLRTCVVAPSCDTRGISFYNRHHPGISTLTGLKKQITTNQEKKTETSLVVWCGEMPSNRRDLHIFADDIWPRVQAIGDVTLTVAGPGADSMHVEGGRAVTELSQIEAALQSATLVVILNPQAQMLGQIVLTLRPRCVLLLGVKIINPWNAITSLMVGRSQFEFGGSAESCAKKIMELLFNAETRFRLAWRQYVILMQQHEVFRYDEAVDELLGWQEDNWPYEMVTTARPDETPWWIFDTVVRTQKRNVLIG